MAKNEEVTALLENAQLIWLNFSGRGTPMNAPGNRECSVSLEPAVADALARDGWFVKDGKEREVDGEIETNDPTITFGIKYRDRKGEELQTKPKIKMIGQTSGKETWISEDTVDLLDTVEIAKVDLILRQFAWEMPGGKSGIKAYLKTMYITIAEDYLDLKYAGALPQED